MLRDTNTAYLAMFVLSFITRFRKLDYFRQVKEMQSSLVDPVHLVNNL